MIARIGRDHARLVNASPFPVWPTELAESCLKSTHATTHHLSFKVPDTSMLLSSWILDCVLLRSLSTAAQRATAQPTR